MIANGVNMRYKIPLFRPLAGFSPNCWAVLVHMAHWAWVGCTEAIKSTNANMVITFFMQMQNYGKAVAINAGLYNKIEIMVFVQHMVGAIGIGFDKGGRWVYF